MSRFLLLWIAAHVAPLAFAAPSEQSVVEVRLKTRITSYFPMGSPFECVVIRALESEGKILIPRGSIISGSVSRAARVGLGLIRDRARLELRFSEYRTPDGRVFPLQAKLMSIDNARERVTSSGVIRGVVAANDPNRFIFGIWTKLSPHQFTHSLIGLTGASNQIWSKFEMGPIGAVALLALRYKMFPLAEPEIQLPPGTDMNLLVTTPEATGAEPPVPTPPAVPPALADWLREEPFTTERLDGRAVPDIVNMAFIGSREDLLDAFSAAGWSRADPPSIRNYSRMFGAYNSMREYASAPVSTLFYQQASPTLVFEKSLNSVAKRHHVRIWQAGLVDGQPVWLGAATHDTGIGFDIHSASFTHKIDLHIDLERTKVATDLVFGGCSGNPARVERTIAPGALNGAITDGAVTVLDLQSCTQPSEVTLSAAFAPPGNKVSRFTRRMVLESRNYILRENVYYWGFRAIQRKRGAISD